MTGVILKLGTDSVKQDESLVSTGPLALVTSASKGIGAAIAAALAERGFDLVVVARRRDRIEHLSQTLSSTHGVKAFVVPGNIGHPGGVHDVLNALTDARIGLSHV